MFRENKRYLQPALISDVNNLSPKRRRHLEESWAGTFRQQVFVRLDEKPFEALYADEPSRPNIAVNVLMGLETLKAGFGWSDAEMYDHFVFDLQVRYALGYESLGEGEFELRSVYNFRRRLSEHLRETGENLVERVFTQITDEQLAAFQLDTRRLRMDSTQIASNICQMSRVQLLVEVLQRVHRMLSEADQSLYAEVFAPYLKGSSGQYVYHLKGQETASHLQAMGELMQRLIDELAEGYAAEAGYHLLRRVFSEQYTLAPAPATEPIPLEAGSTPTELAQDPVPSQPTHPLDSAQPTVTPTSPLVQAKPGQAIPADSVQSPDDLTASYRRKGTHAYQGYVANVTETCAPDNPLQLIVQVQTAPNTTNDADLLMAALPELKRRTGVETLYNDGAFCSSQADSVLHDYQVEQVPTGIRGQAPDPQRLNLADFQFQFDPQGQPIEVTCPHGQTAPVFPTPTQGRSVARFDCAGCPLADQCPTTPRQRDAQHSLHFSQTQLAVAQRRQCQAHHPEARNLRAAVEATVGALKRPFPEDQLPVRGWFRVGCMVIGSALMVNVRRIQRFGAELRRSDKKKQAQAAASSADRLSLLSIFTPLRKLCQRLLRPLGLGSATVSLSF
jgi:hypothetical protein